MHVKNQWENAIKINNYHLFTETEGNSVFCGPERRPFPLLRHVAVNASWF
jgi:hypothetical protein